MAPTRVPPQRRPLRPAPAENGERPLPEQPLAPISSIEPPPNTWRRRSLRFARRLLALGAFAVAGFLAYSFVAAPLLGDDEEPVAAEEAAPGADAAPAAAEEPPPRPESVPQRIPQWAWDLNEWHSTSGSERGPRPDAAPARVPAWYWEWRAWREELAARAGA